jgi:hypothetical protein
MVTWPLLVKVVDMAASEVLPELVMVIQLAAGGIPSAQPMR